MTTQSIGIRGKIFLGFITIAGITLISVIATLIITLQAENFSKRVITTDLPLYETFIDLNATINETGSDIQAFMLTHDTSYKNKLEKTWDLIQTKEYTINNLLIHYYNPEIVNRWNTIQPLFEKLKNNQTKIIMAMEKNDIALATQLLNMQTIPLNNKILNMLNSTTNDERALGILDIQSKLLNSDTNQMMENLSFLHLLELIILVISILASVLIALFTARKILVPLNKAIDIAKAIAAGERDINVEVKSKDETGSLLEALRVMQMAIKNSENELQKSEIHTRELFENIVKSARLFSEHSSKVSSGDLRQRLDMNQANRNDAMAQLGTDLNSMTNSLASVTKEITQACHSMVTTLEEVRHAVDSQSS
ncbi:MAG: HAMP domain-containing protein, partial [Gammaproteobacteria bacterium]|nr:HAMP domain-containing protein [Gammaproteobacteria bacterium]